MARAIDANELLGIERLLDTDVVRQSKTASWLLDQVLHDIQAMPTLTPPPITGDTSDGYHTFNELYHHRAVLFSVICNERPDIAWKSKKHHDGTMYDGMFIVGIDTPEGQATYHYDIEPYWSMFLVKELEQAPEWDGHTPDEAIRRIGTLTPPNEWVSVEAAIPAPGERVLATDGTFVGEAYRTSANTWYRHTGFPWRDCLQSIVTLWMPLPTADKDNHVPAKAPNEPLTCKGDENGEQ